MAICGKFNPLLGPDLRCSYPAGHEGPCKFNIEEVLSHLRSQGYGPQAVVVGDEAAEIADVTKKVFANVHTALDILSPGHEHLSTLEASQCVVERACELVRKDRRCQ
jgi:hypothetical protein